MNRDEAREAAWNLNRARFTEHVSDMDIFHAGFDVGYQSREDDAVAELHRREGEAYQHGYEDGEKEGYARARDEM